MTEGYWDQAERLSSPGRKTAWSSRRFGLRSPRHSWR